MSDPVPARGDTADALSERSDEDLMSLVRMGSSAAFRTLVVRHSEKVASFCARITGDRASAREIAQEVWLSLWDGRDRWEPRGRFTSYLYTIAFTRARNHARSRRRHAAVFATAPPDIDIATPHARDEVDRLLERERRTRVFDALAALPDEMREAVVLRFVEDLSYDEMEGVLGVNPSTLRSRVHHALLRLKARLGKEVL